MEGKKFLKVDYSQAEKPTFLNHLQKFCRCENFDHHTSIEKDENGSRSFVNFVYCKDCGKSQTLVTHIPKFKN